MNFSFPHSPHLIINSYVKKWFNANRPVTARTGIVIPVSWNPPHEGWIKLNVDGSRDNNSSIITAGGVLRNSLCQWVKGFMINKGCGSVIEAEL